jgi:hypothetical protein
MTQDQGSTPAQPPEDFQEYSDARFGFKVQMPKRFKILPATMDPLARMIRGLDEMPEEEQAKVQPRMPVGFWDPEVIGQLDDGQMQPLRLFEYDALRGGDEAIDEAQALRMWDEIQEFLPQNLAGAKMPGFKYLETRETKLGALRALAFDFTWDGPRPGHYGGDRVRVVWAMSYTTMFHVYHHCSGDEWEARLPELEAVLATFELLKQAEVDKEAARSAVAFAAYEAAKEKGDSEEAAMTAAQAAYEAADEDAAAPDAAAPDAAAPDATDATTPEAEGGAAADADDA